jgi:hypothetical protein
MDLPSSIWDIILSYANIDPPISVFNNDEKDNKTQDQLEFIRSSIFNHGNLLIVTNRKTYLCNMNSGLKTILRTNEYFLDTNMSTNSFSKSDNKEDNTTFNRTNIIKETIKKNLTSIFGVNSYIGSYIDNCTYKFGDHGTLFFADGNRLQIYDSTLGICKGYMYLSLPVEDIHVSPDEKYVVASHNGKQILTVMSTSMEDCMKNMNENSNNNTLNETISYKSFIALHEQGLNLLEDRIITCDKEYGGRHTLTFDYDGNIILETNVSTNTLNERKNVSDSPSQSIYRYKNAVYICDCGKIISKITLPEQAVNTSYVNNRIIIETKEDDKSINESVNTLFNYDICEHESRFFLYSTEGKLLSTLYVGDDLTHSPDFCLDYKYILLITEVFVYIIDSLTGKLIINVPSPNTYLADVFEDHFLITVSGKGVIRVWNLEGNLLLYYDLQENVLPDRFIYFDSKKKTFIVPTLRNVYVFSIPFLC